MREKYTVHMSDGTVIQLATENQYMAVISMCKSRAGCRFKTLHSIEGKEYYVNLDQITYLVEEGCDD